MSEDLWQLPFFIAWPLLDLFLLTIVARRGAASPLRTMLVLFLLVDLAWSSMYLMITVRAVTGLAGTDGWGQGAQNAATILFSSMPGLYLLIIGRALPSRLTRWAATTAATYGVLVYSLLMAGWVLMDRVELDWGYSDVGRPIYLLAQAGAGLFGLVAAAVHLRSSSSATGRRQSMSYLLAFAWRDVLVLVPYLTASYYVIIQGSPGEGLPYQIIRTVATDWMLLARELVFLALLSYAILAGRVIDLDRRYRWTISKATLAAIFIGVFVGVQTFVSEALTSGAGLVAGSVAAGALFFAIAPLQRLADRFASATVHAPDEDVAFYEEQVRIAYSDGSIGAKERATLASIRERIGISAEQALAIEERVAASA